MKDRTRWLADCGWGVMAHWLAAPASSTGGSELPAEEWNRRVDAFDADPLAGQLHRIGAGYFLITIGQCTGHYLAPNPTYDRLVGGSAGKCARRDLVTDLSRALRPKRIRLMTYLPAVAPSADRIAARRLGWENAREAGWAGETSGQRLAPFQRRWEAVVRDWSRRWGRRVSGWWIDGCYFADAMYRHPSAPNFRSFAGALRAGNPDSLVAFNPGVRVPVICHTEHEDYTAGEISTALPECPGPWVERSGRKARYHVLSYLGEFWGRGEPRFPDELVAGYTRHVMERGGVVTWDVPVRMDGSIPGPFLKQLARIGRRAGRPGRRPPG